MSSSEFFVISEERRASLAIRWLSRSNSIPVEEDIVYAGICRKGEGRQAAEAFIKWFYSEETQRAILEDAKRYRSIESSFGVAGGFSAIRSVNEKLFPLVITSYSIHYTKLYDLAALFRPMPGSLARMPTRSSRAFTGPGPVSSRGYALRRPAAPRITSYNVCYTKLLR